MKAEERFIVNTEFNRWLLQKEGKQVFKMYSRVRESLHTGMNRPSFS